MTVCDVCRATWYCPPAEIPTLAASPHWCGRPGVSPGKAKAFAPRCPYLGDA